MAEQVEVMEGARISVGANKAPLSDEVLASLEAVRIGREAALARARRETVRTRVWFAGVIVVVGVGVTLFGLGTGRRVATSAPMVASPPRAALAPALETPTPPPVAPAAASAPEEAVEPAVVAASSGSVATRVEDSAATAATAPAVRPAAGSSQDTRGCGITSGQARWRADVDACAKLFESRPNDAALALTIAHSHHARGHIAQSGEWARRAIALDSHSAEAFVILARAEKRAGRPDASIQAYRGYLALVPNGWHAAEARAALRRSEANSP